MSTINIKGLDKAAVLAALYNRAHVLGLGVLRAKDGDMSIDDARKILADGSPVDYPHLQTTYFDYLHGRVMKVDISKDEMSVAPYDRDNGQGAALRALQAAGLVPK